MPTIPQAAETSGASRRTVLYATPLEEAAIAIIEVRANVTEAEWYTVAYIDATRPSAKANAELIAGLPEMVNALLDIKRIAGKSDDADPFALLDLIAQEVQAVLNKLPQQ